MTASTFTCEMCGAEHPYSETAAEEAAAEFAQHFPGEDLNDAALVCNDCFAVVASQSSKGVQPMPETKTVEEAVATYRKWAGPWNAAALRLYAGGVDSESLMGAIALLAIEMAVEDPAWAERVIANGSDERDGALAAAAAIRREYIPDFL